MTRKSSKISRRPRSPLGYIEEGSDGAERTFWGSIEPRRPSSLPWSQEDLLVGYGVIVVQKVLYIP